MEPLSVPVARPASALPVAAPRTVAFLECGTAWTRAWLFGQADGQARLLARAEAPTLLAPPIADLSASARIALERLEAVAGRRLLANGAALTPVSSAGAGVDALGMALSVGGALRAVVAGPGAGPWESRLQRAAATIDLIVRPAPGTTLGTALRPAIAAAWPAREPPHAVIVFGPGDAALADPQAREMLRQQIAALAQDGANAEAAFVVVGGLLEQQAAREALGGRDLIALDPVNTSQLGGLQEVLATLYERRVLGTAPGFVAARDLLTARPVAAAAALGRVARFLAQRYGLPVLALNVGASGTIVAHASAHGTLDMARSPWHGVRRGAGTVLRGAGAAQVARWLGSEATPDGLTEAVLARMLHPQSLPVTVADLELDHALAREALRLMLERPAAASVIFGTGGVFAGAPRVGQAALIMLDAVQPRGPVALVVDVAQAATALGGVSLIDPTLAAEVVENDALLVQLGTCFSAVGTPPPGEPALRVTLEYAGGHQHTTDIPAGVIEALPLAVGQQARVTLTPARGVDVGVGPGERARIEQPVEGGRLGVIIDARGRPLELPTDPAQRRARLRQWRLALGG